MMRRSFLQILGLSSASTLLSGCGWNDSSWNQKITVTVDTPHGPVSGSAVTYIAWSENQVFKDGARWQLEYKGEAAVVDLGAGKYLFALLISARGPNGYSDDIGIMGPQSISLERQQGNEFRRHTGVIPINSDLYPMLVTFTDLNDPKTVIEVKPPDLAATLGAGYSLKSVTLEITDDKVTEGVVEKVLAWLPDYAEHQFRLNGKKCVACPDDNTFAESIGIGNFRVR